MFAQCGRLIHTAYHCLFLFSLISALCLVHHTAIQSNGFRSLQEGQSVRFNVVKGPKGWQAENVEVG